MHETCKYRLFNDWQSELLKEQHDLGKEEAAVGPLAQAGEAPITDVLKAVKKHIWTKLDEYIQEQKKLQKFATAQISLHQRERANKGRGTQSPSGGRGYSYPRGQDQRVQAREGPVRGRAPWSGGWERARPYPPKR